jgi:N-formylglutamate amidohydrolase
VKPGYTRYGPAIPASPVILSVPHAGRDYPAALRSALAVPVVMAQALEDRHADTLALVARSDEIMFVQDRARAWIDLNRAEDERDPRVDEGAPVKRVPPGALKLRSGLGLIPRRAVRANDLWERRFTAEEVEARLASDHRPYHAALAEALAATRDRFGIAILLDVHSMPPLDSGARVVVGDRFGRSAAARFVARIEGEAGDRATALNAPYAGGYVLDRHADPVRGIHAVQLELDRSLYLDARFDRPGGGFAATAAMLRRMIAALADEALTGGTALAAE